MDRWLFWADRGEGKTSTLVKIANDLSKYGYKILFISTHHQDYPPLNNEIKHKIAEYKIVGSDYQLSLIRQNVRSGNFDFLIIDDFDMTGFSITATLEIDCNIIISYSSYKSDAVKSMVPVSLIGKENFLEIVYNESLPPEKYFFNQTFLNKRIKYQDIVNTYIRDKKIEQIL